MTNFKKTNTLINSHYRLNYKILLFFTITAILFTVLLSFIFSLGGDKYIAPTIIYTANSSSGNGSFYEMPLSSIIFGIGGFVLFSTFAIVLINIVIIDEFKSGNIVYWMTTNNSRFQIILAKVGFLWLSILTIFTPYFITAICFSITAKDIDKYAGFIIARAIEFLIFILMTTLIFTLIAILLIDKYAIFLSICIAFVAYTFVVYIAYDIFKQYHWIKYISPFSLVADPLLFGQEPNSTPEEQRTYNVSPKLPISVAWNVGSVFINLFVAIFASIGSIYIYKRLDFNI